MWVSDASPVHVVMEALELERALLHGGLLNIAAVPLQMPLSPLACTCTAAGDVELSSLILKWVVPVSDMHFAAPSTCCPSCT